MTCRDATPPAWKGKDSLAVRPERRSGSPPPCSRTGIGQCDETVTFATSHGLRTFGKPPASNAGNTTLVGASNTKPLLPIHMRIHSSRLLLLALSCGCLGAAPARAGTPAPKNPEPAVAPADDKSIYDKIWGMAKLYKSDDGLIQDISFVGRAQFEYFNVDSNQGDADDWETRRLRAGLKIKFLQKWTLHAEANFDADNPDPFYTKLTDAYLMYTASDALAISVGKQSVKFGLDGGTSSRNSSPLTAAIWPTTSGSPRNMRQA